MTEVWFSCERAPLCAQGGRGGIRSATDVISGCDELGVVCDWVAYGDGVDRHLSQSRIDESRVLVQNRHCEQRSVPSLHPSMLSS